MINVIGLGYIGLPTALMLAKFGLEVVGTDRDIDKINSLMDGNLLIDEEGIIELYEDAKQNIKFTSEYQHTHTYIVTVPTPYQKKNKKLDPEFLLSAVESVLDVCDKGATIIIESTISPGTIDKHVRPLIRDRGFIIGEDIHLVHAPERIIPGNMVKELTLNSRTIGADCKEIGEKVKGLYSSFCKSDIVVTDIRTAEMTKVVENTYRDVNIAFANELAQICHSDNMDVYEIIKIANKHPRVNILNPGPGVGGHCISVDPWFLVGDYPELTNLIKVARVTNDFMPNHVLKRIKQIMNEHNLRDISKIGLYGLTYKEDVNDTRESPTLQLINNLEDNLAFGIKVFDPYVKEELVDNQYMDFDAFLQDIEIVVLMVGHQHIKNNESYVENKIVLDTKNIFENNKNYHKL
ncbi:UDP-N-acetyl-D-mannosaminuronic acid dehydrogenase [Pontibacillus halophilus JSM 076056 = DSM 19796]|uniref:UDP-N-acetyl-D-mannosaminuronic acid dehydrogenase n=1 Tax=Pontibacillus halophilus JSM 076056 = DSM 19796 TaxID=1385510 RepID=A0A0A5GFR2_9BACI|nr:nucleotide sugar dehydrogenase [Pontibacillus halophilus]KGX89960.1 UDP-N-acetyl-D-mannosaminuronic acid dehydrogenase [Pontibacillus halophilus JSM 076056 = DSM 19796]